VQFVLASIQGYWGEALEGSVGQVDGGGIRHLSCSRQDGCKGGRKVPLCDGGEEGDS
jgi:hypothetical protein